MIACSSVSSKTFPIYFPLNVLLKIKEWCNYCPDNEWSGTLFYTTKGNFEDDSFVITCKDIFVQNIGSAGFTSFKDTAEYINYADKNDLLDCYVGLIHSHDRMNTFFSSTDMDTLKQEGECMPHFLSVIVNNNMDCVAKLTRVIKLNNTSLSYKTYNAEEVKVDDYQFNNDFSILNIFDLKPCFDPDFNVIKNIREEINNRFTELKPSTSPFLNTKPLIQGELFEKDSTYSKTSCNNSLIDNNSNITTNHPTSFNRGNENLSDEDVSLMCQYFTGNIMEGNMDIIDLDEYCNNYIEEDYEARFKDKKELESWLNNYTDYICSLNPNIANIIIEFIDSLTEQSDIINMMRDCVYDYVDLI